jgi:serine/threonine protein kinase
MEVWLIVVIALGGGLFLLALIVGLAVCLTVRRYERRKAIRTRRSANGLQTVSSRLNLCPANEAEGFQALATDALSDSEIRDLNKSIRRLHTSPTTTPGQSRKNWWFFDRSNLIGKLAFNQWHFRIGHLPIYTARTCSLIVFNRSSQPIRVSVCLVFIHSSGTTFTPDQPHCSAVCDPHEKPLRGDEKYEFQISIIPIRVGDVLRAFIRITAHSMEGVSFAPYYLPLHVCGEPIMHDAVPEIPNEELEGGERIGAGAAGFVFRKVIPGRFGGRMVAIKKFNIVQATQEDVMDFQREASNLSRLNHPCVLRTLGVCSRFPHCSLVFEYMPLGSLDRYVRPPEQPGLIVPMAWRYRIRLALDAARALCYLHAVQVLHRDIKDANFLVVSQNPLESVVLKIADFSLSKHSSQHRERVEVDAKGKKRASISGLGAPQWRSIESFRGEEETAESDVWSLGVVMWQLATLQVPFSGQCRVHEIAEQVPLGLRLSDPPSESQPPPGYLELVKSCWAELRLRRPNCLQIISQLRDIQVQSGWEAPCNAEGVQWTTEEEDDEDEEDMNGDDLSDDGDDNAV